MKNYVWYVTYGSNMSRQRFLHYIIGGRPEGAKRTYPGCRDVALPIDDRKIVITDWEVCFGGESTTWGGGAVAFVRSNRGKSFTGRAYLITEQQLYDIWLQEMSNMGNVPSDIPKTIDLRQIEKAGQAVLSNVRYGLIACLGKSDEWPLFSFTFPDKPTIGQPSAIYRAQIEKGLKEIETIDRIQVDK